MKSFDHVLQPKFDEIFKKDYTLKGKWKSDLFGNSNPIMLELGCGKGEYTVGLATKYPSFNFIGIDIKGARIWRGAKEAKKMQLENVAFLRTHIELINSFFDKNEVQEIWITFPDPQLKKRRNKKRLTGARFLNSYKEFLKPDGIIHLKTDNTALYEYTMELIKHNSLKVLENTEDLYENGKVNDILKIQTFYESQFLKQRIKIKYIKFQLSNTQQIEEPEIE